MRIRLILSVLLATASLGSTDEPAPRILLVVDASASMATDFGVDAGDRIGAVRGAVDMLTVVLEGFDPHPAPTLAIRAFGDSTTFTEPDACSDSNLVLGWTDAPALEARTTLNDIRPGGHNALGRALALAAEDLGEVGPRDLVVVMLDDLDSCGVDVTAPVEVLTRDGDGVRLVFLGVGLSQFDSIQASGWAAFRNARTPDKLASDLLSIVADHLGLILPTEPMVTDFRLTAQPAEGEPMAGIFLNAPWLAEALDLTPVRDRKTLRLGLGNVSITATNSAGDVQREVTRIRTFPGHPLAVRLPPRPEAHIEVTWPTSGWDRTPEVTFEWDGAPEGAVRAVFSDLDSPATSWWTSLPAASPSGSATMRLPEDATTGVIELRRPLEVGVEVVASAMVSTPGRTVRLTVPAEVLPGTVINVAWDAVAAPGDLLTIVPLGTPLEVVGQTVPASEGSPSDLLVPEDLCTYEIRYLGGTPYRVLAHASVEALMPPAGLLIPPEVPAGRPFEIRWWGPEDDDTVVTIARAQSAALDYVVWNDLSAGSPVELTAPALPGDFEVRIVDRESVLVAKPVTVTEVAASITVAPAVRAGRRLAVAWEGPAGAHDFLALVPAGQPLHRMVDFVFVSAGSPTSLAAPTEPGTYEVRYVTEDPRRELAQATVEVEP